MIRLEALGTYDSISRTTREFANSGVKMENAVIPSLENPQFDHDVTGRHERLSATAQVIRHIVDTVVEEAPQYPPYGISHIPIGSSLSTSLVPLEPVLELPTFDPFSSLRDQTVDMFCRVSHRERERIRQNPNKYTPELVSVFKTFEKWSALPNTKKINIASGFQTGGNFITHLMRYIPITMVESGINPSEVKPIEIAQTGFPLVTRAAQLDIESFKKLISIIGTLPGQGSTAFEIKMKEGKPSLEFKEEVGIRLKRKQAELMQTVGNSPYSRCPASVVIGGESAIRKMWDLLIVPASDIYDMNLKPSQYTSAIPDF